MAGPGDPFGLSEVEIRMPLAFRARVRTTIGTPEVVKRWALLGLIGGLREHYNGFAARDLPFDYAD